MFFQCFIAITLFYCAHWQTYITGSLKFGKFDVTECQCSIIAVHLISACFGTDIWMYKVPLLNIELRVLPILMAFFISLVLCYYHIVVVCKGGIGKNGSTVAGTSVLSPSIPIGIVITLAFMIYQKSTENIYENHPCLYILAFGIVAAKVTNKLVVAHMTRSELDYFDSILIGPGMLFFNQYFNTFINEYIVLWLCLVYSVADLLHYCTIVCNQICNHMNIQLFKITPKLQPVYNSVTTANQQQKLTDWKLKK
ncbi:choline/ethanolaminephosphotransferase 1-like [Stegodyphus dumicola]|uniref:choline/ethanolaminephosphotransferase 1-like n=1 Tax=Stegodyphus dumicola TaxID=202533 RepID=UPI0015B113AA|nr:choline/ethanolaminephosphotransferase 1-like [Stegodyphus dumicola]